MKKPQSPVDVLRIREIAAELARQHQASPHLSAEHLEYFLQKNLEHAFEEFADQLEKMWRMSRPGSRDLHTGSGFAPIAAARLRALGISGALALQWEQCDICHSSESALGTIRIGGYAARVHFTMCEPCLKRLASVVDARLDDRRLMRNRR